MQSSDVMESHMYTDERIDGIPIIKINYDDGFDVNKYLQYLGSRSSSPASCDASQGIQDVQDQVPLNNFDKYLEDLNYSPVGVIEIQDEEYTQAGLVEKSKLGHGMQSHDRSLQRQQHSSTEEDEENENDEFEGSLLLPKLDHDHRHGSSLPTEQSRQSQIYEDIDKYLRYLDPPSEHDEHQDQEETHQHHLDMPLLDHEDSLHPEQQQETGKIDVHDIEKYLKYLDPPPDEERQAATSLSIEESMLMPQLDHQESTSSVEHDIDKYLKLVEEASHPQSDAEDDDILLLPALDHTEDASFSAFSDSLLMPLLDHQEGKDDNEARSRSSIYGAPTNNDSPLPHTTSSTLNGIRRNKRQIEIRYYELKSKIQLQSFISSMNIKQDLHSHQSRRLFLKQGTIVNSNEEAIVVSENRNKKRLLEEAFFDQMQV